MSFPKQVEEAATLAEELHSKMFAVEENTEEAAQEEEVVEEQVQEEEAAPAVEENIEDDETYKARYFTLKGMYDADVPRLHKELKELKSKVFERLGEAAQPKDEPKEDPLAEKLTKYREEYGDDLIEMARLIARSEFEPFLKQQIAPVEEKIQNISETQVAAAQEEFKKYLDSHVKGDWRSVWSADNQAFIEFLSQKEPYGLYTYGDLVDKYNNDWDADGISNILNTFLEKNAPAAPPAPKQQAKDPAKDAIVAPSRSTQTTTPTSQEKRIWTQDMIREFERNDRANKYDAETSQAMWEDLLSAPSENRIRR